MDKRNQTVRISFLLWVFLACLLMRVGCAYGHKLKLFAMTEGKTISGYTYFSGGARPRNLTVSILASSGQKLGEIKTNDKGEFTFAAKYRCDHFLTVESGDGHCARFLIKADELPGDLPSLGNVTPKAAEGPAESPTEETACEDAWPVEMEKVIARALSKQLRPLREQLGRLEEGIRFRDVLGGIGYILGIAGLACYFLARRRAEKNRASAPSPQR